MQTETAARFGLRDGQFFAEYRYKNLHWVLCRRRFVHGQGRIPYPFGFGDLRDEDIERIVAGLGPQERFEGWHEGWDPFGLRGEVPVVMVRITSDGVVHRRAIVEAGGR